MKKDDVIQGRYRLERLLGKGGMAEVWCAHDERLQRAAAVKFLAPQLHGDPEFLVRFFSEAQLVARISHPNVTHILDFGEYEERPYLVMEHVAGGALTELTGQPMLPERAAEIVSEAAWGAGAAHAAGMVHRDIKPGNILLTEEGHAKLADFGIASTNQGEHLTATGQAIGSPHYISPEQASGRACTPRSDVYSLGVVLYELLTGRPPFDAENVTAIAIAHVESQPVPPSHLVPDLDPDLEAIVLRCLQKDPEQRFSDGRALAAALEEPASAAAFLPLTLGELEEYEIESRGARPLATGLIAALLIALIAAGVWGAGGRDSREPQQVSRDLETEHQGENPKRVRPSPTPASGLGMAAAVTPSKNSKAPSPSPSKTGEEEDEDDGKQAKGGNSGSPDDDFESGYTEPTPEPTSEPSPTSDPSSDPSPEPTESS